MLKAYHKQTPAPQHFLPRAEELCVEIVSAFLPTFDENRKKYVEDHLAIAESHAGIAPTRPPVPPSGMERGWDIAAG